MFPHPLPQITSPHNECHTFTSKSQKITFSQLQYVLFQKFLKPPLALIYSLDTHSVTGMVLGGKNLNTTITWFLISRTHCLAWRRQWDKLNDTVTGRAQTLKFHLGSQGRLQGRAGTWAEAEGWQVYRSRVSDWEGMLTPSVRSGKKVGINEVVEMGRVGVGVGTL